MGSIKFLPHLPPLEYFMETTTVLCRNLPPKRREGIMPVQGLSYNGIVEHGHSFDSNLKKLSGAGARDCYRENPISLNSLLGL